MAQLPLRPVGRSLVDVALSPENAAIIGQKEAALAEKRLEAQSGWGPSVVERVHEKGKLSSMERIALLCDPGTEFLPINSLVNWGRSFKGSKKLAPGAGVLSGIATVMGRRVILIANDNTVASGSWWPLSPEKIIRAQQLALKMRAPVIYLVDCSGLFLPEQSLSFPGHTGAGHIFRMNSVLAASGVPQIAGVFGDCIAGGGYMPIISDRVYMTESAYMVIAGAALIKGAKSLKLTSLDIGGPEVHVHQSGCADVRVPDDTTALLMIRQEIGRLPSSAVPFYRHGAASAPPRHDPSELASVLPADHRMAYDMREVIGRLVDDSLFHEVMAERGQEMITGVARISGLWVGIIANNLLPTSHPSEPGRMRAGGILYREGIAKISAFSRACNEDGTPVIWLQDIAGFDIGVEAEAQGLLGFGSSLIYSNSTNTVPMVTVLLRKASGAGYYAMAGLPYEPALQLSTPLTRQAVMEGRTLAIAAFNTKLDDDFEIASTDPVERQRVQQAMEETAARIEADMDPVAAAARMDTDEVVSLAGLRDYLVALTELAWATPRHVRNPRIWSLHDLEVLSAQLGRVQQVERKEASAVVVGEAEAGFVPVRIGTDGTFWRKASPRDPVLLQEGAAVEAHTTIGLIEVMKTFTPIKAGVSGILQRFACADGAAVQEGAVLAWVLPHP